MLQLKALLQNGLIQTIASSTGSSHLTLTVANPHTGKMSDKYVVQYDNESLWRLY